MQSLKFGTVTGNLVVDMASGAVTAVLIEYGAGLAAGILNFINCVDGQVAQFFIWNQSGDPVNLHVSGLLNDGVTSLACVAAVSSSLVNLTKVGVTLPSGRLYTGTMAAVIADKALYFSLN